MYTLEIGWMMKKILRKTLTLELSMYKVKYLSLNSSWNYLKIISPEIQGKDKQTKGQMKHETTRLVKLNTFLIL